MPEEMLQNQEKSSAEGSAETSAQEEWLSSAEAIKLVGVSARTLKRRADLGILRRTSVHSQFGIENHYNKEDILKLKKELRRSAEGLAEAIARGKGWRAEGADQLSAGGDTALRALAEVDKIVDQKIVKLTEPFFKLANTLETGFDKLLHYQEQMIEIETNRDRERQKEKEEIKKRAREEKLKARVVIISYIFATLMALGIFGYSFWLLYSRGLFEW